MAQVRVFVDDAVLGRLPSICAKDGEVADARLKVVHKIGPSGDLGLAWLLLFFGPLGWVALVLLAGRSSGERLVIEVPFCDASYDRFARARRVCNQVDGFGLAGLVLLLLVAASGGIGPAGVGLVLAGVVALVAAHVATGQSFTRTSIGVELDGSRRWVTLKRVHPEFAAACNREVRSDRLV